MFVALENIPRSQGGIIAKLHSILTKPKTWVEPRELLGVQYAVVRTQMADGQDPDWDEVEWQAREWSRWILLPEQLTNLPPGTSLCIFDGLPFQRKTLLHTACALIHQTRMPMYRRVLGLLDQDGNAADMLYTLLKYYTMVKVVTQNHSVYQQEADRMMEELGAPVQVNNQLSSLSDCVLVLSAGAFSSHEDFRLPCPILTQKESLLDLRYRHPVITGLTAKLPPEAQVPAGISPQLFAAALSTLCELSVIQPVADTVLYGGKVSTIQEVAADIERK